MILSIREYSQSEFRGFNFLLSSLSPQIVNGQAKAANTSFQEALLAVHGNDEATLPFAGFDQESCELKVAKFRAEKKIHDRLLPAPRYYCICFFPALHALYINLPNWMRIYLMKSSGELTNTSARGPIEKEGEEWIALPMGRDVVGLAVSIFEDTQKENSDWTRFQPLPKDGTLLRVSQFLETPKLGEDGRSFMPLWTMNLKS